MQNKDLKSRREFFRKVSSIALPLLSTSFVSCSILQDSLMNALGGDTDGGGYSGGYDSSGYSGGWLNKRLQLGMCKLVPANMHLELCLQLYKWM